jgi:short-subunit dehydrogenase
MSEHSHQDRVVVVTGASSGIGRATCVELVQRGAHVTAVARRQDALDALVAELRQGPGTITAAACDVTDAEALRRVAEETVARRGRLDGWVNNAAVNVYGPIDAPPLEDLHRLVDVNVKGYVNGVRAALPFLRERGTGTIVQVSSVMGFVPGPYQALYSATKHAIHGFTAAIREELREDGIAVSEIAPGPVDTPLFRQAGNHMGRVVVPPEPLVGAERIATAICRALLHPKDLHVVGLQNRLTALAGRLAPRVAGRVARRVTLSQHFADAPLPPVRGNLHEPSPIRATERDGWLDDGRPAVVALAAAAAVGAGVSLVASLRGGTRWRR